MFLDEPLHESGWLRELLSSLLTPQGLVLELGTGPWSTPIFARIATTAGSTFITSDVSPSTSAWAKQELKQFAGARAIHAPAERVLEDIDGPVEFAYMDNYDWVDSGEPGSSKYGRDLSKRESELAHLEQSMLLLPRLAPDALVLFDDTWLLEKDPPASRQLRKRPDLEQISNDTLLDSYDIFGKGSLAVPFFLTSGFRAIAISERPNPTQILLQREVRLGASGRWDSAYFEWLIGEHRKVDYGSQIPDVLMAPLVSLRQHALAVRATLRLRTRARSALARLRGGGNG